MVKELYLYHGSDVCVCKPIIIPIERTHDFGNAFYLTSSMGQAAKWSQHVARRKLKSISYVSKFSINVQNLTWLLIKKFNKANKEWLDYIELNRFENFSDRYDIVIGPVADGRTVKIVDDYRSEVINSEEALNLLHPDRLKDQYAFKTSEAISYLTFINCQKIGG